MSQVLDVTLADFESVVLEGSKNRPVVVFFWTNGSATCREIQPALENLSSELHFVLAKINAETPENQQLVSYFRISGVPYICVLHQGQMVEMIQEALSEDQLRKRLSRFFLSEEDQLLLVAESALEQGLAADALSILTQLGSQKPENRKVRYLHAKALVLTGENAQATMLLNAFSETDDFYREARSLLELMDFHAESARTDELDGAAMAYRNGCRLATQNDYHGALETFLEQVQAQPLQSELPARKAMLTLFGVLGAKHELTWKFRAKLNTLVFV